MKFSFDFKKLRPFKIFFNILNKRKFFMLLPIKSYVNAYRHSKVSKFVYKRYNHVFLEKENLQYATPLQTSGIRRPAQVMESGGDYAPSYFVEYFAAPHPTGYHWFRDAQATLLANGRWTGFSRWGIKLTKLSIICSQLDISLLGSLSERVLCGKVASERSAVCTFGARTELGYTTTLFSLSHCTKNRPRVGVYLCYSLCPAYAVLPSHHETIYKQSFFLLVRKTKSSFAFQKDKLDASKKTVALRCILGSFSNTGFKKSKKKETFIFFQKIEKILTDWKICNKIVFFKSDFFTAIAAPLGTTKVSVTRSIGVTPLCLPSGFRGAKNFFDQDAFLYLVTNESQIPTHRLLKRLKINHKFLWLRYSLWMNLQKKRTWLQKTLNWQGLKDGRVPSNVKNVRIAVPLCHLTHVRGTSNMDARLESVQLFKQHDHIFMFFDLATFQANSLVLLYGLLKHQKSVRYFYAQTSKVNQDVRILAKDYKHSRLLPSIYSLFNQIFKFWISASQRMSWIFGDYGHRTSTYAFRNTDVSVTVVSFMFIGFMMPIGIFSCLINTRSSTTARTAVLSCSQNVSKRIRVHNNSGYTWVWVATITEISPRFLTSIVLSLSISLRGGDMPEQSRELSVTGTYLLQSHVFNMESFDCFYVEARVTYVVTPKVHAALFVQVNSRHFCFQNFDSKKKNFWIFTGQSLHFLDFFLRTCEWSGASPSLRKAAVGPFFYFLGNFYSYKWIFSSISFALLSALTSFQYQKKKSGFSFLGLCFLQRISVSLQNKVRFFCEIKNMYLFALFSYNKFFEKIKFLQYQLIISLSPAKIRQHIKQIRQTIKKTKGKNQKFLIKTLSPIIRRWSIYYKNITNKKVFYFCDFITFKMLWRWACRRHHKKNKAWIKTKYFKSLNGKNWVFCFQQEIFD